MGLNRVEDGSRDRPGIALVAGPQIAGAPRWWNVFRKPARPGQGNERLRVWSAWQHGRASATGPFQAVPVVDAGTVTSFCLGSGESLSIVLRAWWWAGVYPDKGTPLPAPPCTAPISDVTRVEFPVASGSIQIDLGTTWHEVCSSRQACPSHSSRSRNRTRDCSQGRQGDDAPASGARRDLEC